MKSSYIIIEFQIHFQGLVSDTNFSQTTLFIHGKTILINNFMFKILQCMVMFSPLSISVQISITQTLWSLEANMYNYSRFQITFHCNVPNFVVKFGSSLRSSKVHFRIHKPVCKQRL